MCWLVTDRSGSTNMASNTTIYVRPPESAFPRMVALNCISRLDGFGAMTRDFTIGYEVNGRNLFGVLGALVRVPNPIGAMAPLDLVHSWYGNCEVGWAYNDAGVHNPRIYRGSYAANIETLPELTSAQQVEAMTAQEQLDILVTDLSEICRVVSPDDTTKNAYGSRIRNLLILACAEVESQFKGILLANGYETAQATCHYVKVAKPLRLEEYSLRLRHYRNYPEFRPFGGWTASDPTQSLPWYDAYCATKRDRENKFNRATLEHAISATAALEILLLAQYGPNYLRPIPQAFFGDRTRPDWHHRDRAYPSRAGNWTPLPFAF
jgi:hypothetical protein